MTYQDNNDRLRTERNLPDAGGHVNKSAGVSGFVLAAIVFALIIGGIFLFTGSNTNTASNQDGTTVTTPARVNPPASTTGSGSTSPSPGPTNPGTAPISR